MDAEKNGIFIISTGGLANNYVPMKQSVIDIYSKNTSAKDGIAKLRDILNFLDRLHSTNLQYNYVYSILTLSTIETVQRDNEYAKIMKITLEVTHRDKALIS